MVTDFTALLKGRKPDSLKNLRDKEEIAMSSYQKNFLRIKRKVLKHVWLVRAFLVLLLLTTAFALFILFKDLYNQFGIGSYTKIVSNFILAPKSQIASSGGRTNILIMGVGGEGHEGPTLTDTMLVASVSLEKSSIIIVSIPRDLWIPEIRAKINSAYYWGGQNTPYWQNQGGGMAFAKSISQEVLGIPIHYGVVLDFSAFEKIIDDIGGVEVDVQNSFTDNLYPIAGRENDLCGGDPTFACRYETVSFNKGLQIMDGATALKFVRSRHAEGAEGGDLARESRTQKVVDAIGQKFSTPDVFLNLGTDLKLWKDVNGSLTRDIDDPTAAILARKIFDSRNSISRNVIPEDLLFTPPASSIYDQQEVVVPKLGSGNWKDIQAWVADVLR